jgi:hypothetical protein
VRILARALTGAEQAAFKVDLDGDGHATRKFFNLSERYARRRDYRVDPRGFGLHGLELAPGEVVRLSGGADFTPEDADRLRELAAFAAATLDAFRAATRSAWPPATGQPGWPPGRCEGTPA